MTQPVVRAAVTTPVGLAPVVDWSLRAADRWGTIRARWGVGRMEYSVIPGLYALGSPTASSPVLVSANYKMSFDRLRSAMAGGDAWIVVLDTGGINVWCAAGHGSFGTEELVRCIGACGLAEVVDHRKVVVPQLGAPGIAAHLVRKQSGFKVVWGPVRADDLPAFLAAGNKATPQMRRKAFPVRERAALIPMELVAVIKALALALPIVYLLGGVGGTGSFWQAAAIHGTRGVVAVLAGVLAGTVLTPLLLPWLPGRAFAFKGAMTGVIAMALLMASSWADLSHLHGRLEAAGWWCIATAVAAFTAMNFTGASTFTSLSGVRREMRMAVPLQIAAVLIGTVLWAGSRWSG